MLLLLIVVFIAAEHTGEWTPWIVLALALAYLTLTHIRARRRLYD